MFKLVRIDDEDHREINLIDGKQVIGRDQMFNCDDKRISRQHAEIETMVDSVSIKALHSSNPCFFVKNGMTEAQIIKQNTSINGYHGDKIGFVPNGHWYQILSGACIGVPIGCGIGTLKGDIENILLENRKDNVKKSIKSRLTDNSTRSKEETDRSTEPKKETDLSTEPKEETDRCTEEPAQVSDSPLLHSTNDAEESTQCYQPPDTVDQSQHKRCFVKDEPVSPVDVKKIKTDPDSEDKKPDIDLPSTSGDSGASGDQQSSPSPDQKEPKRERCMYGKDCYRRNPQHKAQFSHPGDRDYGIGPKAECPYGLACAKRDPRHWRDHEHPYGMHPPPPQGIKKKRTHVVQRNGNIFYINANAVNFYDDHFEAEDTDGESVDYDYEFD